LPGKGALLTGEIEIETKDITGRPIERAKKTKGNKHWSAKKRRHTQKWLVVLDKLRNQIICTAFGKGRTHDFRVYKESDIHISPKTLGLTDRGFIGIVKLQPNSLLPLKGSKNRHLSKQDKFYNRVIAKLRTSNEHVFSRVKKFRIVAERCRNRRRRFGLRFNLIAGSCNFENAI